MNSRKFTFESMMAVILAVGLLCAGGETEALAKSKRKAKEKPSKAGPGGNRLVPGYLISKSEGVYMQIQSLNYQINYSNLNDPPKMTINVLCRMDPEGMPLEHYAQARVLNARFDNGEEVSVEDLLAVGNSAYRSRIGDRSNQFSFQIVLPAPSRDVKVLKVIQGALPVFFEDANQDSVFLSYTDPEDGRRSAEADAFQMTLTDVAAEDDGDVMRLTIEADRVRTFRRNPRDYFYWTLVLQNGRKIPSRQVGESRSGGKRHIFRPSFEYSGPAGSIKGVQVGWIGDSNSEIPFAFENIPLP